VNTTGSTVTKTLMLIKRFGVYSL